MKNYTTSYLKRKRMLLTRLHGRAAVPCDQPKKIAALAPNILRGSLIERYKRCGKIGCKCVKGIGHGPKFYLSVTTPKQKPQQDYIPQDYQEQVKKYLENHRKLRDILEEICNINREILKRRKNF